MAIDTRIIASDYIKYKPAIKLNIEMLCKKFEFPHLAKFYSSSVINLMDEYIKKKKLTLIGSNDSSYWFCYAMVCCFWLVNKFVEDEYISSSWLIDECSSHNFVGISASQKIEMETLFAHEKSIAKIIGYNMTPYSFYTETKGIRIKNVKRLEWWSC
jgi:hypothetical protein